MSEKLNVLRVFIASPNDLSTERQLFRDVVSEVNKIKANTLGYEIKSLGWEDIPPRMGRPQSIINEDWQNCDLFVGLLWKRWGSPPDKSGKYSSGFEEEFHIAKNLNEQQNGKPEIKLYFRTIDTTELSVQKTQTGRVIKFRKWIEKNQICFYKFYDDEIQWKDLIREHLCIWIDRVVLQEPISENSETSANNMSVEFEKLLEKVNRQSRTLIEQAMKRADEGLITEAEMLFAEATDSSDDLYGLSLFGFFHYRIGLMKSAMSLFQRMLKISKNNNDKYGEAAALNNIGLIYQVWGEFQEALKYHEIVLDISKENGDYGQITAAMGNIAIIYRVWGMYPNAVAVFNQLLDFSRLHNDTHLYARAHKDLGQIAIETEELDTAHFHMIIALCISRKNLDLESIASTYGNLGVLNVKLKRFQKAKRYLKWALKRNRTMHRLEGVSSNLVELGLVYNKLGQIDLAIKNYEESITISRKIGSKIGEAIGLENLSSLMEDLGDLERAESLKIKSLNLETEIGRKIGMAISNHNLAMLYWRKEDNDKMKKHMIQAINLYDELGLTEEKSKSERYLNIMISKKYDQ